MGKTYIGTLLVALLTTSSLGADHDVMQVQSPFVVKHPLGPSMEVLRRQPLGASTSFRESRNANFPVYGRECFSCSTGTYGSSDWSSSHSSGGSFAPGTVGYPTYGAPHSTSSRQEFRSEQKFVNGQPVYELHHERKFQDGQLVHEDKREKDEDDFGVVQTPGMLSGGQAPGITYDWGVQPGISRTAEEVRQENSTYGSQGYGSGYSTGSLGSDGFSSSFDAEVARLREDLHRQVGTYRSQPLLPTSGGSHRSEYHTQTRYINGKPVYVKKEERKYEDGRLIHNNTEEKDADDLGTSDLQHQYDSTGALSGGPVGGYHERSHYQESYSGSNPWYPASSPYYGSGQRSGWDSSDTQYGSYNPSSSSSSSSSSESTHSSYRPSYGSSARTAHKGHSADSHYSRESGASSPQRPATPDSPDHSSTYPAYRPYASTSTYSKQDSHESRATSPSYRPSHDSSVQYRQESDGFSSFYPAGTSTSGSSHRVQDSSGRTSIYSSQHSSPYTPGHGTSYGTYGGETHESASSSYPSHRPVTGSSTRTHSEANYPTSSSYQGHRPSAGESVTQVSGDSYRSPSYRPSSASHPSSHPSYTPYEDRSSGSRSYSEERHSSSSHSAGRSYTGGQSESSSEDLEERHLLQSAVDSSLEGDDTYTGHVNMNTIGRESSRDYDQPSRPGTSDYSYSQRGHTETPYTSHADRDSSVPRTGGGARTVAIDLSSSPRSGVPSGGHTRFSQDSRVHSTEEHSSAYGQGGYASQHEDHGVPSGGHTRYSQDSRVHSTEEHSSAYGRGGYASQQEDHVSSHSRTQHASREISSSAEHRPVGIPGVISGPYSSHGEGDDYDKERYDISPLDDELPHLPPVENEIESSYLPVPQPADDGTDSSDLHEDYSDESVGQDLDEPKDSGSPYSGDGSGDSAARSSDRASGYSHSSYLYNRTHTIYGTPVSQPASPIDHTRRDYSRTSTVDDSHRVYPATSGSRHYRYNETRRHSTLIGGQQPALTSGSSLTSDCTQTGGCVAGSSQTSSRRSEIRTSKRYINGQLVGITHYERIYENGNLVHENVTEQGVDELTPAELQKYGIHQLSLAQGSYEPESYSQRHEVRQEKKFVNGQQIYDLHHERRFEDGQLVHENRTEKDDDDFGVSAEGGAQLDVGYAGGYSDTANRHEVRQSQHMQQHVTSESRPGSVGQSSETRRVADTSRVVTKPVYTTRRQETRRQQEYINGQPVYDLHHERRYQDGSLVYENKTELDEKESGGSTGYRDALHDMRSGSSLRTASESSYGKPSGASASGSYDSHYGGSYGGSSSSSSSSSSSHVGGSYEGSSSSVVQESSRTHESSGSSLGSSLLTGGSSLSHSGGATTTIFGTSPLRGSGSSVGSALLTDGSSSSGATSTVFGTSSHESSGSSLGSTLHTGGSASGHSGRAATTVIGTSTHESSGSSVGSSLLAGGSSSSHSGGATTRVFGASPSLDSSSRESSSRHYEASQRSSSTGNSGCLTCVLMGGGSGYSSHGSSSSHSASQDYSSGYSPSYGGDGASDGYSQRREMNREEYYKDGQLVRGREEDRSFRDGQLIQKNRRVYSGIPGQITGAEALQSARTSYVSASSASSSSSHEDAAGYGARVTVKGDTSGVCDPNPCTNGSTCIAGLRGPLCVCPFGFKGTRCEEAYCPKRFCRYGGNCNVVGGNHECACKSGYSGARCLTRRSPEA